MGNRQVAVSILRCESACSKCRGVWDQCLVLGIGGPGTVLGCAIRASPIQADAQHVACRKAKESPPRSAASWPCHSFCQLRSIITGGAWPNLGSCLLRALIVAVLVPGAGVLAGSEEDMTMRSGQSRNKIFAFAAARRFEAAKCGSIILFELVKSNQ